jgi:TP901 family phage tail tape measure protein
MNFISSITLQFKDAFSSGFQSAEQSMAGMKSALGEIGGNRDMMALAGDLALASGRFEELSGRVSAMIDEPARLAGSFDSSLRNIQSLTGESNESLAALGKTLLDIGKDAVAGPNAVANAYYSVTSGIGDATVRIDTLRAAVALAEAGQEDLGAATNGLISVINAYGTSAENVGGLSDIFFQTLNKGKGTLGGFVSSMSSISGMAASLGVGFDELGSAMSIITKTQTEAVAATQLKAAMVALLKPNSDMAEALTSLGIESGSALVKQYGLAEALVMVKSALGGSDDAMAKALGSAEALQASIELTSDKYALFAADYAAGLSGAAGRALEAQGQAYEARVARLQAAQDSLKIQIGGDINAIKGFFVDMGTGFLTHVAGPIMSSPVGEAFQGIAAAVAIGAQGLLSFGAGALNTTSQLVTLTATLQNSGGLVKLFGNAFGGLLSPLKKLGASIAGMIGPLIAKTAATFAATAAEVGFAGAMWATAGAVWAATWPILAVVAAVAALAIGGYMLVKHWDAVSAFFVNLWNKITGAFSAAFNWIKNLLSNVSGWVLGAIAVFMPFIGIPALIIKYWDTIKAFFVGLWVRITGLAVAAWEGIKNFFTGLWASIVAKFVEIWNGIPGFFAGLWTSIVSIVTSVANWFIGVWNIVAGAFSAAWTWVSNFFISVWNNIVGVVTIVANWFGEVFGGVAATFAAAWTWVSDLFTSIWEGIKGVVMGFVEWLQPVIDMIIAPFRAIGNAIGGIIGTVKGWFGETVEMGQAELDRMAASKAVAASAGPAASAAVPAAASEAVAASETAPSLTATTTGAVAVPELAAATTGAAATPALAASAQTGTGTGSSGNSLLAEHLAAASRKGIEGTVDTTASDAFMNAGASTAITPTVDMAELNQQAQSSPFLESLAATTATITPTVDMAELNQRIQSSPFLEPPTATAGAVTPAAAPGIDLAAYENEARVNFAEAARPARQESVAAPWNAPEARTERRERPGFTVQNLYLQSEDIEKAFDLYRQLEMMFANPQEAAV